MGALVGGVGDAFGGGVRAGEGERGRDYVGEERRGEVLFALLRFRSDDFTTFHLFVEFFRWARRVKVDRL